MDDIYIITWLTTHFVCSVLFFGGTKHNIFEETFDLWLLISGDKIIDDYNHRHKALGKYTTAGNEWNGMDSASLRLQSIPAPFCKHTNGMDGSGNGNVFLTTTVCWL